MTVSYAEMEGLWVIAGGPSAQAPIAAAIATAESQGNPTIQNPGNANVVGLWQINTSPDAHPEYTIAQMKNPLANAVAAVKISNKGTNWNPWQTYTSGAYQQYLKTGVTPDINGAHLLQGSGFFGPLNPQLAPGAQGVVNAIEAPFTAFTSVADALSWLFNPTHLLRLGELIIGGAILLLALDETVKSAGASPPSQVIEKVAATK